MSDRGAFLSILDYINQIGQVPENLLRGDFGAAGRHLEDLGGKAVNALTFHKWFEDQAQPEDYTSSSQLLGIDKEENPLLAFGTDLVGDTILNPTSWIPSTWIAKGAAAAAGMAGKAGLAAVKGVAGAEAAAKTADAASSIGQGVKRAFAAEKPGKFAQGVLQTAKGVGDNWADSAGKTIQKSALTKLSPAEGDIAGDIADNRLWSEDGRTASQLADPSIAPLDRVALHPGVTPENIDRIKAALQDSYEVGQNEAKTPSVFWKDPSTVDPVGLSEDYVPRMYKGQTEEQGINEVLGQGPSRMGQPGATKPRSLNDTADINAYLAKEPGVSYERNLQKRMVNRAGQQNALAKRGSIGQQLRDAARSGDIPLPEDLANQIQTTAREGASKDLPEGLLHGPMTEEDIAKATDQLLPPEYAHANPADRAQTNDLIRGLTKVDPDGARLLFDAQNGLAPQGTVMRLIKKGTEPFKQLAVYGAVIPRFGTDVRNAIGDLWKAMSSPEGRRAAPAMAGNLDGTIIGSLADSLGMQYPRDKYLGVIRAIDKAQEMSGGSGQNAIDYLVQNGQHDAADILKSGVLNGMMREKDMMAAMSASPWKNTFNNIKEWPARIYKGIDDRARIGMTLELKNQGENLADATRITTEAMHDYGQTSVENRAMRTLVPFWQFQAKSIPQNAKFLAEKPYVASAIASAARNRPDNPIYPYMEGKLNIPLGKGADGNQQYATGFGLPFESLLDIPNPAASIQDIGREVEKSVVGNLAPVLKAPLSAAFGTDPYFETPYGSYSRIPVIGDAGNLGQYYNEAAGTGLMEWLDSPLRSIDKAINPRESPGVKALDMFTGVKVASVDEDRAVQQKLEEDLRHNPQVHQFRTFYQDQGNADPATEDVIQRYHDAKARIKAKRQGMSTVL